MGTSACARGDLEAGIVSWNVLNVPAAPAVGVASAKTCGMASAATAPEASLGHSAR
jgi:hypothetical protein